MDFALPEDEESRDFLPDDFACLVGCEAGGVAIVGCSAVAGTGTGEGSLTPGDVADPVTRDTLGVVAAERIATTAGLAFLVLAMVGKETKKRWM